MKSCHIPVPTTRGSARFVVSPLFLKNLVMLLMLFVRDGKEKKKNERERKKL
jgi:hypothetical protein